jgi:hypothetical protein
MVDVKLNQLWQRKKDGVIVAVRELPKGGYSFVRVQNERTGRHFEVTAPQLNSRYEIIGYDVSEGV